MRNQFLERLSPRNTIQTAQEYIPETSLTNKSYHPYNTMKVRKGMEWGGSGKDREIMRNLEVSPFQRIKRVQKLIFQHRRQSVQEQESFPTTIYNDSTLKPSFKIKNAKNHHLRRSNGSNSKQKEPQNLQQTHVTLQCVPNASFSPSQPTQQKIHSNNGFQQIFKNRCRLQRRKQYRSNEVSLLEMLNRISQKTPLHRYKSRAFESAQRVQPLRFQH